MAVSYCEEIHLGMRALFGIALAVSASALLGCSGDGGDQRRSTPMPAQLHGVYAGHLPCSNCSAIEATLWLREDGRFFLRQAFLDEDEPHNSTSDAPIYGLGRWHWDDQAAEAVLVGAGPERRLAAVDDDTLRLLTPSPQAHILERIPANPPFTDRLRIDGESVVSKEGASFTECLTGLSLPIADSGAFKELRRQQRMLNPRGKVALTTIDAHIVTDDSVEVLVVDRFVTIKPGTPC